MGRYFGLYNATRNTSVSCGNRCWKGHDECDIHEVMHRYHWHVDDEILSGCYDSCNQFIYDKDFGTMYPKCCNNFDTNDNIEENNIKEEKIKQIYLGFGGNESENLASHAPIWKEGKCIVCNYQYDSKDIEIDEPKFDKVFYWS